MLLGTPSIFAGVLAKFINGKNVPGVFFSLKKPFFSCASHSCHFCSLFFCFLWFSCAIVSGSLVCCEQLGAVKVKVFCGGRQ